MKIQEGKEIIFEESISPISRQIPQLCTVFGEKNFLRHSGEHRAVDIFVPEGTEVGAPESGRLCYRGADPLRERLGDIALLGESGRLYYLLHLNMESIHPSLSHTHGVNNLPDSEIKQGEVLGKVGRWPMKVDDQDKILLERVGSNGSHLHLGVYPGPYSMDDIAWEFPEITKATNAINPSLIMNFGGNIISPREV